MRGPFLTIILSYILFVGLRYPFAALLAYVWIDIVKPQSLAYSIINGMPLAMIAAVIALISYGMNRERKAAGWSPVIGMLVFFAVWITITTASANPGINSWIKWDWAFKVVIFSIFIPFVIRSRVHIEAFLLTIVFSVTTISFTGGVKAALGGGGYGVLAVLGDGNTGLSEGSTLAAICIMMLPIIHYMYDHSVIFPNSRIFKILMLGSATVSIFSVVGTAARTGLVAGALLLLLYALRSKHRFRLGVALTVVFAIVMQLDLSTTAWGSRVGAIDTYDQDSSAKGRIEVWKWTAGFALEHPFGGGFDSFKLNRIITVTDAGVQYADPSQFRGKAFHNIYFEVLGEQGVVGLAVYLGILILTFMQLRQVRQRSRGRPEMKWSYDLATKLRDSLAVVLMGGMFIGIAYQCYIFYLVAVIVSFRRLLPNQPLPTK